MRGADRAWWRLGVAATLVTLVVSACTQAVNPTDEAAEPTDGAAPAGDVVEIEWYVGLGTGTNTEQIPVEEDVVAAFNAEHPNIQIELTIVDSEVAEQDLAQRMPTDPPDLIGPVGVRGLQGFGDSLLDLTPFIDQAGVDRSEIEDSLWEVYQLDGKQIGIPMAVYPSFIYYNKTLFDEAELPYPPHEVGEQYEGEDWTWETVRDLAMRLTVDAGGNDATSPDFDPENIDQWGLDAQFTNNDPRAWGTIFGGAGSVVADDGTTAQFPDNWRTGLQFFYDGIWTDHMIPSSAEAESFQTGGNTFQTGRIAMDVVHQWYTCCVYPGPAEGEETPPPAPVTDWDIAVLPVGPDGNITSKLHADTIGILESTESPEAAFEVLNFLRTSPELLETWGALPAVESQQDTFFAALDETFAPLEIDWNVSQQMLQHPDIPNHEAFMPNFVEANAANGEFGNLLWTTPGLDLESEIEEHVGRLQSIFDEAE